MTKTSGVFTVSIEGHEIYVGASSNIEVVYRDYLGWIKKNKAPKAIQSVADQYFEAGMTMVDLQGAMDWHLVFETDNKKEMVEQRRSFKANNDIYPHEGILETMAELGADFETEEVEEVEEVEAVELTVQERNALILERLAEGVSVANVAEEFSVSKSTVYNVKNGR